MEKPSSKDDEGGKMERKRERGTNKEELQRQGNGMNKITTLAGKKTKKKNKPLASELDLRLSKLLWAPFKSASLKAFLPCATYKEVKTWP